MANAATAHSFPQDHGDREQSNLARMSARARSLYNREDTAAHNRQMIIDGKHTTGQTLREDLAAALTRLDMSERAEAETGKQYGKYSETQNPDGTSRVQFQPSGAVENLRAEVARIKEKIRENAEAPIPHSDFAMLKGWLNRLPLTAPLDDAELPPAPTPGNGETQKDVFEKQAGELSGLVAQLESIWQAGRTNAEIKARIPGFVHARAKKVSFGGLAHGYADDGPRRMVETPAHRLGFPTQPIQIPSMAIFPPDGVGMLCWLFGDAIIAKLNAEVDARSDEGRITAAEKPALLALCKVKIWNQRRVTEAAFVAARDAGFSNIKRPVDTPAEVILGLRSKWDSVTAPDQVTADAAEVATAAPKQAKSKKAQSLLDLSPSDLAAASLAEDADTARAHIATETLPKWDE